MTINLLAPTPGFFATTFSGNSYTASSEGIVSAAPGDIQDLLNAGCLFIGATNRPQIVLVGSLIGANMNTNSVDNVIPITGVSVGVAWALRGVTVRNASVSLTTAVGGVYTAASKGGTPVVAASQTYAALTSAALYLDLTLAAAGKTMFAANVQTNLYLTLSTAQGAAATADVYVWGELLY